MRRRKRCDGRWSALSLAILLAACGAGAPAEPEVSVPPGVFQPAALDLNRPCTLLTEQDAADISGLPFYRTIAANLVEDSRVRCAQGVGAYGLHGVVELDMEFATAGAAPRDVFDRQCRSAPPEAPMAEVVMPPAELRPTFDDDEGDNSGIAGEARVDPAALTPAQRVPAPLPVVNGVHCVMYGGAYALLLPDRVIFLRVRQAAGEVDAAATRRLASLVSFRLTGS